MSERKKSNNKMIKRILSGVMAFAIALSMCMVAMPTRVLASDGYNFYIHANGNIDDTVDDNAIFQIWGLSTSDPTSVMSYSDKTLTFKGNVKIGHDLYVCKDGQTIVVNGTNDINTLMLQSGASSVTVKMAENSNITISTFLQFKSSEDEKSYSLQEAKDAGLLNVINGKIDGNKIVYGEDTPTDVKVDDEVSEKGKTTAEAPTYKVTKKDGNTGEITYEKPATDAANVKETEEIPSEVVLPDGNTYKVTKVAKRAFADAPGKEKIKEIKVGENVDEIGEEACKGLPSLEKVNLGKNVKKIDKGAFANCGKLKKADLPADLEEVGESAFERTNLPSAKFGKKVKKVGQKAYYKCKKFKKLTVKSKKLTKKSRVAKNAFAGTNKKFKVKVKISNSKTKAATINVFKQKKIGYKPTWTVN